MAGGMARLGDGTQAAGVWTAPLLWQYAADGQGGFPRSVPGIPGNALGQLDCNTAPGMSVEQFRAAWLGDFSAAEHPHDWSWIQAQLAEEGVYSGKIDGDPGPKTEAAVASFVQANRAAPRPVALARRRPRKRSPGG